MWRCRCDCGIVKDVDTSALRSGSTKSCGCLRKESQIRINLAGKRFGKLVAIRHIGADIHGHTKWLCRCDCGAEHITKSSLLRKGKSRSCGCNRTIASAKKRRKEIAGLQFGQLKVVKRLRDSTPGGVKWLCICSCGSTCIVSGSHLRSGDTRSCGCLFRRTIRDRKGKKNPNWNPHLTQTERENRRKLPEAREWTSQILARDSYTCLICGHSGSGLAAHHIRGYHWDIPGRFNLANGFTMCVSCHRLFHHEHGTKRSRPAQLHSFITKHAPRGRLEACLSLLPY